MKHLKKILALVLVMAMTFTMLPAVSAADDAAVETVAPIAEAPSAEPVAVEEVAAVPAEAPAAPKIEAIETVAAEEVPVTAELQATGTYESDAAAIEAGYFLKMTSPASVVTYANALASAFSTANAWTEAGGKIELIADWDLVNPGVTAPLTSTYTDTSDPEVSVYGAWFDLCGHTLIISFGGSASDNIPFRSNASSGKLNFRNGRAASSPAAAALPAPTAAA